MPGPVTHVLFDFFGTLVAYSDSRIGQGYPRSYALLIEAGAALDYTGYLGLWEEVAEAFEQRARSGSAAPGSCGRAPGIDLRARAESGR